MQDSAPGDGEFVESTERAPGSATAAAQGGAERWGRLLPTTMTRAHVEISHLIRRLGRLLDDLGDVPPTASDVTQLRQVLYSLHAVTQLHFTQEEEAYFSLVEHPREPDA